MLLMSIWEIWRVSRLGTSLATWMSWAIASACWTNASRGGINRLSMIRYWAWTASTISNLCQFRSTNFSGGIIGGSRSARFCWWRGSRLDGVFDFWIARLILLLRRRGLEMSRAQMETLTEEHNDNLTDRPVWKNERPRY